MAEMDYTGYREKLLKDSLFPIDEQKIFIPPTAFKSALGAPSEVLVSGRYPSWTFDPATAEVVTATLGVMPSEWETFSVLIYWTQLTVNTGNVAWLLRHSGVLDGVNTSLGDVTSPIQIVSAPANAILKVSTLATSIAKPSGITHFRIHREATNASDTLASDSNFMGLELVRTA